MATECGTVFYTLNVDTTTLDLADDYTLSTCVDTDGDRLNLIGLSCTQDNHLSCNFDDDDFISADSCCVCGGGQYVGQLEVVLKPQQETYRVPSATWGTIGFNLHNSHHSEEFAILTLKVLDCVDFYTLQTNISIDSETPDYTILPNDGFENQDGDLTGSSITITHEADWPIVLTLRVHYLEFIPDCALDKYTVNCMDPDGEIQHYDDTLTADDYFSLDHNPNNGCSDFIFDLHADTRTITIAGPPTMKGVYTIDIYSGMVNHASLISGSA